MLRANFMAETEAIADWSLTLMPGFMN